MTKSPQYLFHYTVGSKLRLIEESGMLYAKRYSGATSSRERPVLWWSVNSFWCPTANKVMSQDGGVTFFRPTMEQLQEAVGLFRFRLDCRRPEALQAIGVKPVHWSLLPAVAHIPPEAVRDLVDRGLKFGAVPTDWWGTLEHVPLTLMSTGILSLETLSTGPNPSWHPVSLADGVAEFESRGVTVASSTPTLTPAARNL